MLSNEFRSMSDLSSAESMTAEEMAYAEQAAIEEQATAKRTVIKKGHKKRMAELERSRDAKLKKLDRLISEQDRAKAILKRGYVLKPIKVQGETGVKSVQKKLDSADRARIKEKISGLTLEIMDIKDEIRDLRAELKRQAAKAHQYNKEQKLLRRARLAKKGIDDKPDSITAGTLPEDPLSPTEIEPQQAVQAAKEVNTPAFVTTIPTIDQAEAALGQRRIKKNKAA